MNVHYLCHPPHDSVNFVYATELPIGYYAPGTFCVEASNAGGHLSESFQFPARLGQQVVTHRLTQVTARTYAVDVEELATKFFFKLINLDRTSRYVGRESDRFSNFPLLRVQPANTLRLEQACTNHDFYFVGFGSEQLIQQNEG
ncbi:hypothetical protein VDG09_21265 [Xanthomonas campestris pv. raphani]|uniref:hypothetical protein n=1 Tax=Xanthomonas campestris TaxID=339 RepID=UPI0023E9E68C|nr:hypothetical protein [Xanthomonas campestris]MCW2038785.1 hypothetical protein [Xanthomonas campestris]MEA9830132.1 hypothetical protein [Xanthomonas campestris pv. raphani]